MTAAKNGVVLKIAAGVVVICGAIAGAAALADAFLWTEAEAAATKDRNTAIHNALERTDGLFKLQLEHSKESRLRLEHNIEKIAERLNVKDVQKAPPPLKE